MIETCLAVTRVQVIVVWFCLSIPIRSVPTAAHWRKREMDTTFSELLIMIGLCAGLLFAALIMYLVFRGLIKLAVWILK